MKKSILLLICVSVTLISCGGKKSTSKNPNKVTNYYTLSATPITLLKKDISCNSTYFKTQDFTLRLFSGGDYFDQSYSFRGLLDGLYLRDPDKQIIKSSLYGLKSEIRYYAKKTEDGSISVDNFVTKITQQPSEINVCPDSFYDGETVEGAGLNVNYFVNKTYKKVTEALPELKIRPVSINISPLMRTIFNIENSTSIDEAELYTTDNAYYLPSNDSITFLPTSQDSVKNGMAANLWEVPMVTSHEYAHHIFNLIVTNEKLSDSTQSCFGHHETKLIFNGTADKEAPSERVVTVSDVIGALNEGFADLVAYYSLDNNERGVRGIKCLEKSRDVGISYFFDYKDKNLNDALDVFFSNTKLKDPSSCEETNFQDIHAIGAIFAYQANQFMDLKLLSKSEKLKILLKWVTVLNNNLPSQKNLPPRDYLNQSLKSFFTEVIDFKGKSFTSYECYKIRSISRDVEKLIKDCYF